MKFLGEEEWYQQETLKVSAVVSRPLAKVETFIGDDGETAVDIIMTKEQMEKNFGISDDKTVSISVDKNADTSQISKKLREITADVNQCIRKDTVSKLKRRIYTWHRKCSFIMEFLRFLWQLAYCIL